MKLESTLLTRRPPLPGKCAGLTLTAYGAGHTLGGTIWKLRSPSSGTILIALDWNHNRERHLDGTALLASSVSPAPLAGDGAVAPRAPQQATGGILDAVRRPDLLITDAERGLLTNARRKDRDAALLGACIFVLDRLCVRLLTRSLFSSLSPFQI